jgi:hypothetical protein
MADAAWNRRRMKDNDTQRERRAHFGYRKRKPAAKKRKPAVKKPTQPDEPATVPEDAEAWAARCLVDASEGLAEGCKRDCLLIENPLCLYS